MITNDYTIKKKFNENKFDENTYVQLSNLPIPASVGQSILIVEVFYSTGIHFQIGEKKVL